MPRPPKVLSGEEVDLLRECWEATGTVDTCRVAYQMAKGLEKPPSWDTMRRWLAISGIRDDPTDRVGRLQDR